MRERQRAEAHAVQCRRDTAAAKTAKAAAVRSKVRVPPHSCADHEQEQEGIYKLHMQAALPHDVKGSGLCP